MQLRKAAKDCVFRLKLKRIQRIILDLQKELEQSVDDEAKYDSLLQEKIMLDRARAEISKYFGTVISHWKTGAHAYHLAARTPVQSNQPVLFSQE